MLRIGMLGASRVGVYALLAPARALDTCAVQAVAARDPKRAESYAAVHEIPVVHASYQALIEDPTIDLVYIGTPPVNHAELALAAIAAGKPVLVEKPFAMNAREAEQVYRSASAVSVPVFEAMHSLHHPLFARVQAIIQSEEFGTLTRIDARFDAPISREQGEFRWQEELGGGALMDLGVYPLAWCRRLAGESFEVARASATVDAVDTQFEAELSFAGGVTALISSSLFGERHCALMTLHGTKGRVTIDNYLAPHRGHLLAIERSGGTRDEEVVPGPSTYEAQLAAVCATVLEGKPFPFPADDYVRSMAAIDLVRSSWSSD